MSDGTPWRPLFHCRDIAHAFVAFMNAPAEAIHDKAVNIGGNEQNYQVRDVADQVERLIPAAEIVFTGEVGEDPRDYRVNFDRLTAPVPDFKPRVRPRVRHGGAAPPDGGPWLRRRGLRGRPVRPATRPYDGPPRIGLERCRRPDDGGSTHDEVHRNPARRAPT